MVQHQPPEAQPADERRPVPLEEALQRIGDGTHIHTYRDAGLALIGADWDRDRLVGAMQEFGVEEAGPGASRIGHTLVMFYNGSPLFIEAAPQPEEASGA